MNLIPNSEEWKLARCGSLGASSVDAVMAKLKSGGWSASRENLRTQLIIERLTGKPLETFKSAAMERGTEMEPQARAAYTFYTGNEVEEIDIVRHPSIEGAHACPDGYVAPDGGIEIKCPLRANHYKVLSGDDGIEGAYLKQMQWQMACTGWQWVDYVSYCPEFPPEMEIYIKRIRRNDITIAEMEREVRIFLVEVEREVKRCQEKFFSPQEKLKRQLKASIALEG